MIPSNHPHRPIMFSKLRFTLLFPLAALLACGTTPTPSAPASTYLNLTGDWVALILPNPPAVLPAAPVADFMGALQSSGSAVTGTLRAISLSFPQCVSFTQAYRSPAPSTPTTT